MPPHAEERLRAPEPRADPPASLKRVPGFNFDRAQTIASIQRIKQMQKNLKATLVIQHDPRDIGKLPAFPAAAR